MEQVAVDVKRGFSTSGTVSVSKRDNWDLYTTKRAWVAGPTTRFRTRKNGPVYLGVPETRPLGKSMSTAIAMLRMMIEAQETRLCVTREIDCASLCESDRGTPAIPFYLLAYPGPGTLTPVAALKQAIYECALVAYPNIANWVLGLQNGCEPGSIRPVLDLFIQAQNERLGSAVRDPKRARLDS